MCYMLHVLWPAKVCSREYLLSVLLHLTLNLLKGDPPENRDTTLGGNLASTLLKVRNTYSRHQRSSYSVREELQVIYVACIV